MGDALARFVFVGTASLAVLSGLVRGARAQEPCARLEAPPNLSPGWADAVRDLSRALAELPSTDCSPVTLTLSLEPADVAAHLVAQAQDGRRAVRSVAQPSLLVPIALGLVISVPKDAASDGAPIAPPVSSAPPAPPSIAVAPPVVPPSRPAPLAPIDVASPHPVSLWLGIAVGGRIGVPSTVSMIDVEARADVRVEHLLLFVSFRNVPVAFVAGQGFDGDAYHESSIAFGVGRSLTLGRYLLDVSIAPALVTMRLSKDVPEHAHADDAEFRVGASARLNVPLSPNWRLTLAADTDVIPDFLLSEERIEPLAAFPSWTSGLSVGVSGAAL